MQTLETRTPETPPAEAAGDILEFVILEAPDRAAAEALGADIEDDTEEADHV